MIVSSCASWTLFWSRIPLGHFTWRRISSHRPVFFLSLFCLLHTLGGNCLRVSDNPGVVFLPHHTLMISFLCCAISPICELPKKRSSSCVFSFVMGSLPPWLWKMQFSDSHTPSVEALLSPWKWYWAAFCLQQGNGLCEVYTKARLHCLKFCHLHSCRCTLCLFSLASCCHVLFYLFSCQFFLSCFPRMSTHTYLTPSLVKKHYYSWCPKKNIPLMLSWWWGFLPYPFLLCEFCLSHCTFSHLVFSLPQRFPSLLFACYSRRKKKIPSLPVFFFFSTSFLMKLPFSKIPIYVNILVASQSWFCVDYWSSFLLSSSLEFFFLCFELHTYIHL